MVELTGIVVDFVEDISGTGIVLELRQKASIHHPVLSAYSAKEGAVGGVYSGWGRHFLVKRNIT